MAQTFRPRLPLWPLMKYLLRSHVGTVKITKEGETDHSNILGEIFLLTCCFSAGVNQLTACGRNTLSLERLDYVVIMTLMAICACLPEPQSPFEDQA